MTQHPLQLQTFARYPENQKKDYIFVLARAFGQFEERPEEEHLLFDEWLVELKIPQKHHPKLNQILDGTWKDPQYKKRIQRLDAKGLTSPLLLDLMSLAMADGVLMDDEIEALHEAAAEIGVSNLHFNVYLELVHSAYQAAYLQNPEPLFEHNIEHALILLYNQNVLLFEHTRLCTCSKEYNQHIKQRWLTISQQKNMAGPAAS